MGAEPTASIVMATYNRSYLLPYSIGSVLRSDFSDFELIIVGDGCTDDTEDVVRRFTDPRIRFLNLPTNSGAQSAPNNAGIERARGRYILFLNQDDLYFPEHLRESLDFMERTGADIAWSPVLQFERSGAEAGPPDPDRDVIRFDGAPPDGDFDPRTFVIASSWIVRADVCRAVGPWRAAETTRLSPSQEWLFRAHRQGYQLAFHPRASVLCLPAGGRRFSYLVRYSPEHARASSWIAAGITIRCALLECAALEQAKRLQDQINRLHRQRLEGRFPRLRAFSVDVLRRFGVHPIAVERFFDGEGKGSWIANIRRFTGEAPNIAQGEKLNVGGRATDQYFGRGWHGFESGGRWTAGREAEFLFSVASPSGPCFLELSGHPLRLPDNVTFALNGNPILTHRFEHHDTVVRLPLSSPGSYWLTITLEAPTSPFRLQASVDTRTLGYRLSWVRLTDKAPASG